MYKKLAKLKADIAIDRNYATSIDEATFCHDILLKDMEDIRTDINALENIIDSGIWPYPTYTDLMFKI
jgi:glutamine synthetase